MLVRGSAVAALVAAPLFVGAVVQVAQRAPDHEVVVDLQDPELAEASGHVVTDQGWVFVNDSGDEGRLFVVDPETGRTTRTLDFAPDAVDTEALAPEGTDVVWVGDIGDNRARRDHVSLHRVPLDGSKVRTLTLRYPDGPRDAETLVRHPGTGDLFVISKRVLGGTVYRVPDPTVTTLQTLEPVGEAPGLLTDGTFLDAERLLVRNYGRAYVLAWPSLAPLGDLDLPSQRQGESVAVDTDGTVLLGSEGVGAPILRMKVPRFPEAGGTGSASPSGSASTSPSTSPSGSASTPPPGPAPSSPVVQTPSDPAAESSDEDSSTTAWWWGGGAVVAVVVGIVGLRVVRRRRRESTRKSSPPTP